MKRFCIGLVALIMLAVILTVSAGCNWDHDEWMELVNSNILQGQETVVAVSEAVPKRYDEDSFLVSDLRLNFTNNRRHITMADNDSFVLYTNLITAADRSHITESEVACWQSNIGFG